MKTHRFASNSVLLSISQEKEIAQSALGDFIALPGVSSHGFTAPVMEHSAQWLADLMRQMAIPRVEVMRLPGAAPYVYGEVRSPDVRAKTVLVYAHYDVQPIGDRSLWHSDPFKADIREGRMYGRGSADDKSGIIASLFALNGFLKSQEPLPCHIKFLFDGEEECGSPHISDFLRQHRKMLLPVDRLIVPDLVNTDEQTPSLTFCLRGLIEFEIKISVMKTACHSGLSSGAVPDATAILAKLYANALGKNGEVIIPGVGLSAKEKKIYQNAGMRKILAGFPFSEKNFKREMGFLSKTNLLHRNKTALLSSLWFSPALTLVQTQVAEKDNYANRLQSDVSAVFSLRIAPHQDPTKIVRHLKKYFEQSQPYPAQVQMTVDHTGCGFFTDPTTPTFQMALEALAHGTSRKKSLAQGAGLTIPFVHTIQKLLGRMDTFLVGIEDPKSNAHAENESLSLATFEQTTKGIANLYAMTSHG